MAYWATLLAAPLLSVAVPTKVEAGSKRRVWAWAGIRLRVARLVAGVMATYAVPLL